MDLSGGRQTYFSWAPPHPPELVVPLESAAIPASEPGTMYFHGHLCRWTGESIEQYGRTWHEFVYLEGAKIGQFGHTQKVRG